MIYKICKCKFLIPLGCIKKLNKFSKVLQEPNLVVLKTSFCQVSKMDSSGLKKCCPSQYSNAVDGTSVACSIMLSDVKQNIMYGRWDATLMGMTDGKAII